ncbi:MAG: 4-hydroxy-tetrahydrodipicolinate synthase [Bacteroidales bacterium]|nr:4-hydroxy-tetrahydrodipicolinate synthase [Bacteroidales bacterium]MBN2757307.1 4-hydroxy-tetrahydrodipicolinate synthase [Bacteroidales bacterium]
MSIQEKLKGTGVAIVTPFNKDSNIDFLSLERLLKHLLSNGVNYLVALGTTGEAATLNKDEKQALLNFVIDYVDGRVPIVAGFGGNNTNEISNSIQQYDFKGIDAILSVAPYYNKPSQEGLYYHYKEIATISPVPVILYNVPGRTSVNINASTVLKLAADFDNIVAVKEASGNFEQIMQIIKGKPKDFMVISGDDLLTLPLISLGVHGVISVVANAFPKQFSNLVNLSLEGNFNEAMKIQNQLMDFINLLFSDGNPAGIKAALDILNICPNNFRLPLSPVSHTTYNKLKEQINTIN